MKSGVPYGPVWLADFDEGYERPCVVVSREELNRGHYVLVVPLSSSQVRERSRYPNHVRLPAGTAGLTKDSVAMTNLVRPLEVSSLREKYGQLPDDEFTAVLHALAWTVGLFEKA